MGMIRGALIFVISFLLFLGLFFGNIFLTLNWSLDYDVLQPGIKNVSQDMAEEWGIVQEIETNKQYLDTYCQTQETIQLNQSGFDLNIPCTIVKLGTESIIAHAVDSLLDQIYYKQYDCEFWQCIKSQEDSTVLISETAKEYWKNNFKWALIISIILFIALILVESRRHAAFITAGILTIIAALPFKKADWLFSIFPESKIIDFVGLFFTKAENVFTIMSIIGIALILLGLAFKFFHLGIHISNLFRKKEDKESISKDEVKDIVKKEVKKQKDDKDMPSKKELKEVLRKKKK